MDEERTPAEEELASLKIDLKKLKRENKHLARDNEMLRMANEQAAHVREFIQRDNERQLFFNEQLLKTSPYMMFLTDEKLNVVMASDMFFLFSGMDHESIKNGLSLNEAVSGFMNEEEAEDFIEQCKSALEGEFLPSYVFQKEMGGYTNHLQITIRAMRRSNGHVVGLNIIFVDMTEMIEAKEKADEANHAKSSFLANMSHEIRTPINAVLGMDEMIIRETSEPEIRSYAENIRQAGKTLLALINEILDFSKVEEGKMEIIPTRYELGSLVNDLTNMVQDRVEKKGLKLEVDIDPSIPHELYGDEIRIKQCIVNLLNNSVKYTEKGKVTMGIGFRPKDAEHIVMEVRVTDTGIGMKEEDLERLFAPFARIEEKRNRNIEGTGLGMSITKRLLELMGTSLSVDSVYGKGSTFYFDVVQKVLNPEPIGNFAGRFSGTKEKEEKSGYQAQFYAPLAHILVVDDTETNLLVIKGLLKATGVQLDTVDSGFEALRAIEKQKYDVILVDHMMPEMDGIETLAKMKERPDYNESVHIALTANAISGAREMYLKAGFDDYLSKPVDGTILEQTLKKYIPASKQISPTDGGGTGAKEEEPEEALPVIPDWIREIPGIDVEEGIKNCGGEESFLSVIETFHDTADQKKREIIGFHHEKNWSNYTIRVHAMKSSARIIGAKQLSSLCEQLENAGNALDIDFIETHTDPMLGMLEFIDNQLEKLDEVSEELPMISDKDLKEAYQTIYDYALSMEFGIVESVMNSLKEYRLKTDDEVIMKAVNDKLMLLDWDAIVELVKNRR